MTTNKHDVYDTINELQQKMDYLKAQILLIWDVVETDSRPNCEFGKEKVNDMILSLMGHQMMFEKFSSMFNGIVTEFDNMDNVLSDVFREVARLRENNSH